MDTNITVKRLPAALLKPAKYNPRKALKPTDAAYQKIKRSLNDFGYVDPIVWNEVTGNIVGGHQRYKVLTDEGATEFDCVVVHIENMNDEKALNVALNKATGGWEPRALADLLQDLQIAGYDLDATGFDAAEVDDLFSQVHDKAVQEDDCDIDPNAIEPYVRMRDIWTLGKHKMMCADATDASAMDALMGDTKANLLLTDPPCPEDKNADNGMTDEQSARDFYLTALLYATEHMASGASAYIFHQDRVSAPMRMAFQDSGFHLSGVCVWVKNSTTAGRSPYQSGHELVLFGWRSEGKHKWFSDRAQTTVWNFDKQTKSQLIPSMKPVGLMAYPIKNSSAPNGVVLDPFGGSGSTLIACEETDRVCRMMEIDPCYASIIVERFHRAYPKEKITVQRGESTMTYAEALRGETKGVNP